MRRTIFAVLGSVVLCAAFASTASAQVICLPNLPILSCPPPSTPQPPPVDTGTTTPGPAPVAQPPTPPKAGDDFVGIVSDDAFANSGDYRTTALTNQAAVGVRLIRTT